MDLNRRSAYACLRCQALGYTCRWCASPTSRGHPSWCVCNKCAPQKGKLALRIKSLILVSFFMGLFVSLGHAQYQTASRIRYSSTAPTTCNPSVGDIYFNTTLKKPYYCSATNTWATMAGTGGGGGGGITSLNGLSSASQNFATGTSGTDFVISSS